MTQPIQEPTTQRQIRSAKHGIDQLFRRPCRCCCVDMEYARISFNSGDSSPISVPDSSATSIAPMTEGFTSDPTILQIDLTNGIIWWDFDQRGRPAVACAQVLWDQDDPDFPGYRLTRLYGEGGFPAINELNGGSFPGDLDWQTSTLDWYLLTAEGDIGSANINVYQQMGGAVNVLYAELSMFVWSKQETTTYP